jgi:hypothetical protein
MKKSTKPSTNHKAFEGVNLSNVRGEDETYEDYKKRLKQNSNILKFYSQMGKETFSKLFPGGASEILRNNDKTK